MTQYHKGPLMDISPSGLSGLVIVIGFFFLAFGMGIPDSIQPFYLALFIAVELFAILRWTYNERKESQSMTLFSPDGGMEPTNEPIDTRAIPSDLIAVLVQLMWAIVGLLIFLLIFALFVSDSPLFAWVLVGVVVVGFATYIIKRIRRGWYKL